MINVLVLETSLNGATGNSTKLNNKLIQQLEQQTEITLLRRDLAAEPLPHLSAAEMQAWMTAKQQRSTEQQQLASLSDTLLEELRAADLIIIGMPMYNFGVPSTFKAWIDRIARAGETFRYAEEGPQGLLNNKRVIINAARGGFYAGSSIDSQSQYLRDVFAFIGLTEIEFIYAEGLSTGADNVAKAWQQVEQKLIELFPSTVA